MNNATSQKESQQGAKKVSRRQIDENPTVETEVAKAVENGEEIGPAPEPEKVPELYIDAEGIGQIDRYLMVVGQAEDAGIVEYKSAFHNLVQKLRQQVKTK